jgi:hypothetical protein
MITIRPTYPFNDDYSSSSSNIANTPSVKIAGPTSPFGDLIVGELNPTFQVDFVDGVINSSTIKQFIVGTGASASTLKNELVVTGGTDSSGFSKVLSKRVVPYQPGQGTISRFTARFGATDPNVNQYAGLFNGICSYRFGYQGSSFGIHYRRDGEREIRALTITTGSSSIANATITLDGQTKVVPLTNGGSTTKTAYEIAKLLFYNIGDGWTVDVSGNVVYFISLKPKPYSGIFSFSHGTAAGTFSTLTVGVNPTEEFIQQSSWNIDTMDGGGPSRVTFDPLKANVYEAKFQYLGYGDCIFSIESTEESVFIPVHIIKNAGNTNHTVIRNPMLFMSWSVENNGVPTAPVSMYGASAAGFIVGIRKVLGPKFGYSVTKTIGTIALIPIFSIKTTRVFNNTASTSPIRIGRISIGSDITKPAEIKVYANAVLNTANFVDYKSNISRAAIDTSATSIDILSADARLISTYSIGKSSDVTIDVSAEDFDIQVGEFITFCIDSHSSSATQDISISITWFEG